MSGGKLPEGWVTTHLSEICSKPQYGYTTKSSSMGDVKFLRTTDITKGAVDWSSVPYCMDAPEDVSKYQLQDRDIVISRAGSVGFSFLVQNPPSQVVFASYLIRFKPVNYFSEYYLKRFLESSDYWNQLSLMSAGNAVQNVNAQKLSTLTVPIPPIAEQKIIAEKLDTLLAQVDSTKARLELIPQILKRFRQAVLVSAVNGKLQAESSSKECCTIDSLCLTSFDGPFGSKLKTSDYTNSGIRVVRLENIGHLEFNSEKETYISHEKYKSLYNNTLKENDLIFSSFVDEDVRVCLIPQSEQTFINKADCFCLRLNPSLASPHYLALVLASKTSYEQIKEKVQGITRPRINLRTLRSLKFDIPDLKEQHEIVRRVEQLFAWADTIEKQY
ncbi:restriction endonuclease subunit S [Salmonella enterica]|nr:restriction endonuclease subunit S [Salmonella enterica]EJG3989901.1 restriction endonuclease subunit S [Salmonella enterica]